MSSSESDSALRELEEEEAAAAAVAAAGKAVTSEVNKDSERRTALVKLEETEEKLLEAFGCCQSALEEIRAAAGWTDQSEARGGGGRGREEDENGKLSSHRETDAARNVRNACTSVVTNIENVRSNLRDAVERHRPVPFTASEYRARQELGVATRSIAVMAAKVRALRPT